MSMIGNYIRVSQEELDSYFADSSLLEARAYPEHYTQDESMIDIEKSWEGIYYLLTGQTMASTDEAVPPLSHIFNPNQMIDEEQDMGYGPAMFATIAQVNDINNRLQQISTEDFASAFNGSKMNELEIYPSGIWDNEDTKDYLIEHFELLKKFYNSAADNKEAVIFFIS